LSPHVRFTVEAAELFVFVQEPLSFFSAIMILPTIEALATKKYDTKETSVLSVSVSVCVFLNRNFYNY